MKPDTFNTYLQKLAGNAQSDASERTHYSALESFMENAVLKQTIDLQKQIDRGFFIND